MFIRPPKTINNLSTAIQWLVLLMLLHMGEIFLGTIGLLYIFDFFKIVQMPELPIIAFSVALYSVFFAGFIFLKNIFLRNYKKKETNIEKSEIQESLKMAQTNVDVEYLGKKRGVIIKYHESWGVINDHDKINILDDLFDNVVIEIGKKRKVEEA